MSSVRRSFDLPVELAARLKREAELAGEAQRAIVERALRRELYDRVVNTRTGEEYEVRAVSSFQASSAGAGRAGPEPWTVSVYGAI